MFPATCTELYFMRGFFFFFCSFMKQKQSQKNPRFTAYQIWIFFVGFQLFFLVFGPFFRQNKTELSQNQTILKSNS